MILTKLKGGLGNQMFQYATARFLGHKTNTTIVLDISSFNNKFQNNTDTQRDFDLGKMNISSNIDSTPLKFSLRLSRFLNHKIFKKFHEDYDKDLLIKYEENLKSGKNIYLEGYFQSEKNFAPIRDILLKEFSLKEEFKSPKFTELQSEIQECNSVGIHIRRGDYIKSSAVTSYHGICSIEYYKNAMKLISEKSTNTPNFYFFSDDPQWVSENLELNESAKIISDQKLSAVEELFLMSSCKHNIIANSTFSWWAAWLNQNHDKIVISPTPWVEKTPNPHPNIIPETWIKIPKNH